MFRKNCFRSLLGWVASIALLPAAIVIMLWQISSMIDGQTQIWTTGTLPHSWQHAGLSEDDKLLLGAINEENPVECAKALCDRWPDDPVYYAEYINILQCQERDSEQPLWLEAIRKGQQIDPENGYYDLLEAGALIKRSSRMVENEEFVYPPSESGESQKSPSFLDHLEITDAAVFAQGMDAFQRAMQKPLLTNYGEELIRRRLSALPPSTRLSHLLWRQSMMTTIIVKYTSCDVIIRGLAARLCAHTVDLTREGQWDQAVQLLRQVQELGRRMAERSDFLLDLLIAAAIHQDPLSYAESLSEATGHYELAQQAHALVEEGRHEFKIFYEPFTSPTPEEALREAGIFWSVVYDMHAFDRQATQPIRDLEYAVGWEIALLYTLGSMVLLAVLLSLLSLVGQCRTKRECRPMLLFIGWRAMGRIALFALVVPISAYAFYAVAAFRWGGNFGINYAFGRVLLETMLTSAIIIVLLLTMGYSAIRRRAMELGLPVRGPLRLRRRPILTVLAGGLLLICAIYIIGWWVGPLRPEPDGLLQRWFGLWDFTETYYASLSGAILAVAVWVLLAAWLISEGLRLLFSRMDRQFCLSLYSNLIPLLAGGAILVALACSGGLRCLEARAVRRVSEVEASLIFREIETRGAKPLKNYLITAPLWPETPASEPKNPVDR